MATYESIILGTDTASPLELNTGQLALEKVAFTPARKKPRWVEGNEGAILVDEELAYDNCQFELSQRVEPQASMDLALAQFGGLLDMLQEMERRGSDGLPCSWTPSTGTRSYTFYALLGEAAGVPVDWESGWLAKAPLIPVTISARPFLYGAEVTGPSATGSTPIVTLSVPSVPGDVRAEGRLVVTDPGTQARRFVEWGLENRFAAEQKAANGAVDPPLLIDADQLVTTGFSGVRAFSATAYSAAPYLLDDFSTNTIANYTFDTGGGTLAVSGGQLVPSSTAEKALYYSAVALDVADAQVTVKVTTGASVAGAWGLGPTLRRLDASNYLHVALEPAGAATKLNIYKKDAGVLSLLAATGTFTVAAGTSYWLRLRAIGNVVTAEMFTSAPTAVSVPAQTISYTLAGADATKFGTGIAGDVGLRTNVVPTDYRYDDFAIDLSLIRSTLTTSPVAVCGTGTLKHIGTFRPRVRINASSASVRVRLTWQEGDGPFQALPWVTPPLAGFSGLLTEGDLGSITVPKALSGTQQWTGRIEAYGAAGDTIDVDYLGLTPAGEGYGKARVVQQFETPTSFSARDEFNQTAGALSGQTLPAGGTWSGAGDADDFAMNTTDHTARRTAVSDTGPRLEIAGSTNLTNTAVQVDFFQSGQVVAKGVFARYVDVNNYLRCYFSSGGPTVEKVVAGTPTQLATGVAAVSDFTAYVTMRLQVDASGRFWVWMHYARAFPTLICSGQDSALATGGTLATGKPGIFDWQPGATAATRDFDNFIVFVPTSDEVIFPGRSLEIRSTSAERQNAAGTLYGPVQTYRGSRFFLPAAGTAARITRIAVSVRRNDVDEFVSDVVTDSTKSQVFYTPRYLEPR